MKYIIIDVNIASLVFGSCLEKRFLDLNKSLATGKPFHVVAVHGGKLTAEYAQITGLRRMLVSLGRAGKLRKFADDQVKKETVKVQKEARCKSNDHHIIGLASVSTARILTSNDKLLCADFLPAGIRFVYIIGMNAVFNCF